MIWDNGVVMGALDTFRMRGGHQKDQPWIRWLELYTLLFSTPASGMERRAGD